MDKSQWWLVGICLGLSGAAEAHTHLKSSTPVDNSTLKSAPEKVDLHFSEAARLTALSVQGEGGVEQKLAPLPAKPSADTSVALPTLAPGKYVVTWRVISDDNHVMTGKLHFTIDASANTTATTSH